MYKNIPFPIVSLKLNKTKRKTLKSPDPRANPFHPIQTIQDDKFNSLSPRSSNLPRLRAISPSYNSKNSQIKKSKNRNINLSRAVSLQLFKKLQQSPAGKTTPTFSQSN